MRRMRDSVFVWGVICGCGLMIVCAGAAGAEEIDPQTRAALDAILAGWRANQALVKDLRMTGSRRIVGRDAAGEMKSQSTALFKYFQVGEKRRVDYSYTQDSDRGTLLKQHEARWVRDGERSLNYVSDTGLASVQDAAAFNFRCPVQWLHTYQRARDWANHIEQIEFYLSRWDAEREKLVVEEVKERNQSLLRVSYETGRGGQRRTEWYFDPERGYQVVAVKDRLFRGDGTPHMQCDGSWEVREAAPGVWLAVGCDYNERRWRKEGEDSINLRVHTEGVSVNTGDIDLSLFSLEGLKVPAGMVVADHRVDPPRNFRFQPSLLTEVAVARPGAESLRHSEVRSPEGGMSAAGRIAGQIKVLRGESAAESVSRLDEVEAYYWPGVRGADSEVRTGDLPLRSDAGRWDVGRIMSNRRFLKVYQDLSSMSKAEAEALLKKELEGSLGSYQAVLAEYMAKHKASFDLPRSGETSDAGVVLQIGNNKDGSPTLAGARLKVLSLVLLAGNLRLEGTKDAVEAVASFAAEQRTQLYGDPFKNRFISSGLVEWVSLYNRQVLATGILGVSVRPEGEARILASVGCSKRTKKLPHFDARLTAYDLDSMGAADYSRGAFEVEYVGAVDDATFEKILERTEKRDGEGDV